MNKEVALIVTEAFFPEDFLINDLVTEWDCMGYKVEVLTRIPSYPFGKVFKGFKNRLYQKTLFQKIIVHRILVIPGYHKNVLIKILNYLSFVLLGSIVALFIGNKYSKIFVYQTGPLTIALPAILIKKIYKAKITVGNWLKSGIEMAAVGMIAALVGYFVGKVLGDWFGLKNVPA